MLGAFRRPGDEEHCWAWSGTAICCELSDGLAMRNVVGHEVVQLYAASFQTAWRWGTLLGMMWYNYMLRAFRRPEWWGTLMTMKWYSYMLPAFIQTAWVVRDIDDHEVVQLYAASFHTDGLSGEGHWWPWSGIAMYCQLSYRRPEWWGTLMTMKWYSYMLPAFIQTAWVVRDIDDHEVVQLYAASFHTDGLSGEGQWWHYGVVQIYAASFHTDGLSGEGHWWPWSGTAICCQLSYRRPEWWGTVMTLWSGTDICCQLSYRRPEWWGTLMTMKWYSYILPAFIQTAWVVRDIDDHEVVQLYAASFHTDGLSGEGQWWHYWVVQLYAASFHTDGLSGEGHWWPWSGTAICCQLSYRRPEWWGTVMTLWSGTAICCQLSYRRPEWWGTLMTMKWYSYILPAFRRPGDEEHCWAWSGTAICCELSDGLAMRNIVGHEVVQLYAATFQTAWVVREIDDHEVVQLYAASFHTGGLSGEGHWRPWSGTAMYRQISYRRPE